MHERPIGPLSNSNQHGNEHPIIEEDLFSPHNKELANISFTSSPLIITEAFVLGMLLRFCRPKFTLFHNLFRCMQLVSS